MKIRISKAGSFPIAAALLIFIVSGCGWLDLKGSGDTVRKPEKIESYSFKGLNFSYYLVPQGLSRDELLALAAEIHRSEPESHLIFVDDESGLREYINYAKGMSVGRTDIDFPQEWAEKHIVANLQKFTSGKWVLNKGYGYEEIGEIP